MSKTNTAATVAAVQQAIPMVRKPDGTVQSAQPDLAAELERLRAENAALKAKASQSRAGELTIRVSQKGAVSVYGLGRWPVTLYASQWPKLLAISDQISKFIEANKASLSFKTEE